MTDYQDITYTLYKRGSSTNWQIQITLPGRQRIRRSSKTDDKEWAEQLAQKMVEELKPKQGMALMRSWIANSDPYLSPESYERLCSQLYFEVQDFPFDAIHRSSDTLPRSCYEGHGVVYALQKVDSSTKIGISANPRSRIKSIETMIGERLQRIFISQECTNFKSIEKDMHHEFLVRRMRYGEWFNAEFLVVVAMLRSQEFVFVEEDDRLSRLQEFVNQIERSTAEK